MITFTLALAIFLGLLSVANKVFLYLNIRSGWTSGMVIGLVSSVYFYLIGLKVLALAELGFFLVMFYGLVKSLEITPKNNRIFNVALSISLIGLSAFLIYKRELVYYELISSLSFIWGGYALALKRYISGWVLLFLAHVATSIASYEAGELIFSSLQIVSGIVCVYAVVRVSIDQKRLRL